MKSIVALMFAAAVVPAFAVHAAQKKTPDQIFISAEAAEALLEIDYKANPDKAAGPKKLRDYLHGRPTISIAELQAIRNGPPATRPELPSPLRQQTGPPPRDAFTLEQVRKRFEAEEAVNRAGGKDQPTAKDYEKRLTAQAAPGATWFTMEQIQNAEKYDYLAPTNAKQRQELRQTQANYQAFDTAYGKVLAAQAENQQGPRSPRIRRSWSDVLYDEDQSQSDRQTKAIGDLEGALFSYSHDGNTHTDTWNAHAAAILPITYKQEPGTDFSLRQYAFAPSVTYDRVTTTGDAKTDVDSLLFRVGAYFDFYGLATPTILVPTAGQEAAAMHRDPGTAFGYGLQVRAAGVYATDENFAARAPGFEGDLEPRFHYGKLALGYEMNLWPKAAPARSDRKDGSFLTAQLRGWLHTEGGDVQDTGQALAQTTGTFFRLGPATQFTLAAPDLPGYRTLSLTAFYSYLGAAVGPTNHRSYFRFTLAYDLFHDPELNHKVGIAASYERGGLGFTQQDVDSFTLGLNVLF